MQCKINVYFVELLHYFNASDDVLKKFFSGNLAGRIVAINGRPHCVKLSTVTPIFYCIFEMFKT